MARVWATSMSTNPEAVINPLIAACDAGFVPTDIRLLTNPSVEQYEDTIQELIEAGLQGFDQSAPSITFTRLDEETAFKQIIAHFRDPIEARSTADTVAVDVTPGRKFVSALAFQVGLSSGADAVYYLHLASSEYFGRTYPTIPRPAANLIDFATYLE